MRIIKALSGTLAVVLTGTVSLGTAHAATTQPQPKVIFQANPITDRHELIQRALSGITDLPTANLPIHFAGNVESLVTHQTKQERSIQTTQLVKEVVMPDGQDVKSYVTNVFTQALPSDTTSSTSNSALSTNGTVTDSSQTEKAWDGSESVEQDSVLNFTSENITLSGDPYPVQFVNITDFAGSYEIFDPTVTVTDEKRAITENGQTTSQTFQVYETGWVDLGNVNYFHWYAPSSLQPVAVGDSSVYHMGTNIQITMKRGTDTWTSTDENDYQ